MAKIIYYQRRETFGEFLGRFFEQMLTIITIVFVFITLAIICNLNKEFEELERRLGVNSIISYEERIPIEYIIKRHMDSVPIPEQTIEETSIEETIPYLQSDVELLARLMYAEEGIFIYKLSEEDAKYVNQLAGSVVLNRERINYKGAKSIKEVIYSEGQYACVENGTINQEVPQIVYEWAEELLENGPIGPKNMIYQAEFKQGSKVYKHIENQYFCLK